jgi:hypothetical protein
MTRERLKKYKIDAEYIVTDPDIVIRAGKAICDPHTWQWEVKEWDGDELSAAMSLLFPHIPDEVVDGIELYASGLDADGDVSVDWWRLAGRSQ